MESLIHDEVKRSQRASTSVQKSERMAADAFLSLDGVIPPPPKYANPRVHDAGEHQTIRMYPVQGTQGRRTALCTLWRWSLVLVLATSNPLPQSTTTTTKCHT